MAYVIVGALCLLAGALGMFLVLLKNPKIIGAVKAAADQVK